MCLSLFLETFLSHTGLSALHTHSGKFYCFLLEFGMKKNQLISCSQILAEMIDHSKLPAEVETPVLSPSWLVTPSHPQALQNTLTCSH